MSSRSDTQLQSIDRATLTPLVRQALGSEAVEVTDWDAEQIHGGAASGNIGSSAVHRVSGHGRDQGDAVEWSLILKVLYPQAHRDQPSDYDYWRREAHAFESGLLDDLLGGLAAPRCFGVVEHPGGECWIWMEDVADEIRSADEPGRTWPLEHYGVAARHLGHFNGAYLTGRPIPCYPWLRRRSFLHDYAIRRAASRAQALTQLHSSLDHPLVRRAYPPDVVDTLSRRWEEREKLQTVSLDALDRLPQTLCHNDAFRRNLLTRSAPDGSPQTVAIDWDLVGIGWIGQELTKFVGHPLALFGVDGAEARERDRIAFEGYLEGLHDAGWRGDRRHVRFGQTALFATRATTPFATLLALYTDESRYAWVKQTFGVSIEELADHWAERYRHPPFGYWEEEARELLDEL